MTKDQSAQWILLSGIVIAVGLIVLMLLINTAMLTGHSSAESIMNFPKNDIRELKSESIKEAYILCKSTNEDVTISTAQERTNLFNSTFDRFVSDIIDIYAYRGAFVEIGCVPAANGTSTKIENATLAISYLDGDTSYSENYNLIVWGA
ncbi:hypothetical protein CUJ83_03910 [Methanocella sp. CWC-04]|uniref:Uncharacterized protein n=2 Tax=Methanooceanicella nereidis TaxID=2052831 RepID=A0AAP2RB47_9EURY|nr:hypothetical protein [Methanocella sp. CWC-04]